MLGFRSRVLIATTLCCVVAVPLLSLTMTITAAGRITRTVIESGLWLQPRDIDECRQRPQGWHKTHLTGAEVSAADVRAVLAGTRDVGLPVSLLVRLQEDQQNGMHHDPWGGRGGVAFRRVADSGPCSLFVARWSRPPKLSRNLITIVIVGAAVAIGLAVGLAVVVAIRPLVARLQTVRRAASAVGDDQRYQLLVDRHHDDIGAIAHALDGAHRRMVEDAHRLEARGRALECHLENIAHDLKTPIASLQMALDRAISHNQSPAVAPLLSLSLQDIMYIAGLVENLRIATRFEHEMASSLEHARVELGQLIERVCTRFALLGEQKRIEVTASRPDEPVLCGCDPSMAEQAVANLVHNALTYGHEGGHIAVLVERKGARFSLTVVDDGPGVPEGELPALVRRTFRSDEARRRDPRGGGLGLAITRAVCERAGWSFALSREQPHGLRATISGVCLASMPS